MLWSSRQPRSRHGSTRSTWKESCEVVMSSLQHSKNVGHTTGRDEHNLSFASNAPCDNPPSSSSRWLCNGQVNEINHWIRCNTVVLSNELRRSNRSENRRCNNRPYLWYRKRGTQYSRNLLRMAFCNRTSVSKSRRRWSYDTTGDVSSVNTH